MQSPKMLEPFTEIACMIRNQIEQKLRLEGVYYAD